MIKLSNVSSLQQMMGIRCHACQGTNVQIWSSHSDDMQLSCLQHGAQTLHLSANLNLLCFHLHRDDCHARTIFSSFDLHRYSNLVELHTIDLECFQQCLHNPLYVVMNHPSSFGPHRHRHTRPHAHGYSMCAASADMLSFAAIAAVSTL